jgi:hypothetical protein
VACGLLRQLQLHGFKEAPRFWHKTVDLKLQSWQFVRVNANFYVQQDGLVFLLVNVDDFKVAGSELDMDGGQKELRIELNVTRRKDDGGAAH